MKCQKYRRTGAHNTPLFFWCDDQNLWNSALLESAIPRKKTEEKHHKTPVDRKHQRDRSKEGEGDKNKNTENVVLLIAPLPKRRRETESRLKVLHHPW